MDNNGRREFDVLLSFAGPEREYARAIYDIGIANGLRIFLDEEFQHEIWGKNLIEYLDHAYREQGTYVVALISSAYRERAFTKVERRAAFDRMIQEPSEYLLPVTVDDSWIDGLPRSTAFLDLRVHGVLGVCKILVQKVRGLNEKLTVPSNVFVPRIPLGRLPGEQLATYLMELCARPQPTIFGALIYDERSAELRKLLRDRDYWDALDKASGPFLEVFAIRDIEDHEDVYVSGMLTAASMGRSRSRRHYFSRLLREYFGEEEARLVYPSFLLFLTEGGQVRYCRLIPFRQASIEQSFESLRALLEAIANAIDGLGVSEASSDALWEHIERRLLTLNLTLHIQNGPRAVGDAVRQLTAYVER